MLNMRPLIGKQLQFTFNLIKGKKRKTLKTAKTRKFSQSNGFEPSGMTTWYDQKKRTRT